MSDGCGIEHKHWRRIRAVIGLAQFARGARRPLALSVVLALLAAVLELAVLYVVYRAVAGLIEGTASAGGLVWLAVLAGLAALGDYMLFALATGISHVAAFRILCSLRVQMTDRLARLPLGYFARRPSGELRKILVDDVERLELFLAHGIPEMTSGLGAWIGATVWLFTVDWRMATAAAIVVPIAFWLMHIAMGRSDAAAPLALAAEARMNISVVDYMSGIAVIRIFNRVADSFRETRGTVDERNRTSRLWTQAYIPLGAAFYSLVVANIVVIVPTGLWLYLAGEVRLMTLLFFVILGIGYSVPLLRFFNQGMQLAWMASSGGLVTLILTERALPDTGRTAMLADHSIEFREVSFSYTDREVLTEVSFTAAQGQVTALVGPSGAGKTTIARLITRAWDVDRGGIFLGGVDVREMAVEQLMREVAVVFQDTFLFDDTIEGNIRLGKPGAILAEVQAAARAAGCHEFISALPEGYHTVVGERGARLSGGERQRITIARAILKDSPVVVLDEATAFTDPESEAEIQDAISALVTGRTLIVVAHRLSTIAGADQIVVIDQGQVVDTGTHDQLLTRCELYERMWHDHLDARRLTVRDSAVATPAPAAP